MLGPVRARAARRPGRLRPGQHPSRQLGREPGPAVGLAQRPGPQRQRRVRVRVAASTAPGAERALQSNGPRTCRRSARRHGQHPARVSTAQTPEPYGQVAGPASPIDRASAAASAADRQIYRHSPGLASPTGQVLCPAARTGRVQASGPTRLGSAVGLAVDPALELELAPVSVPASERVSALGLVPELATDLGSIIDPVSVPTSAIGQALTIGPAALVAALGSTIDRVSDPTSATGRGLMVGPAESVVLAALAVLEGSVALEVLAALVGRAVSVALAASAATV
ncbi:MAG TPA: hypothetical protein VHR66_29815 [Gemmataceae bacterium]|nr:hypothetical protein [Gemmataceae bacterium]